ncbi:MAG: cytochrome c [Verrucomicrobiota bacterium]
MRRNATRRTFPRSPPPATWIPHPVNQSGAGHEWIRTDRLGNLENHFLRFGFHQGSLYKVFIDEETTPRQAGIVQLDLLTGLPLLKGAQNPIDGQVYLTGMQVWGSRSTLTSGLRRLRYTGKPSVLPTEARIFRQGILLRFEQTLPSSTMTDLSRYVVQRWNYLRSPKYGSSHYRLNGQTGQDPVALSQIEVSHDGKALFAVAPDMQPSHQLSFDYRLEDTSGRPMRNTAYFTAHTLPEFEPAKAGFPPFTIGEAAYPTLAAAPGPVSIEEGKSLSLRLGCLGCHSTDGSMVGMKGPGWKGLYQSDRLLTNGKTVVATPDYLRESILNPTAKTARGFDTGETGMPPYEGILKEEQLQSIILYLKSLR